MHQLITFNGVATPASSEDVYTIMPGQDGLDYVVVLNEQKERVWQKYVYSQEVDVSFESPKLYEDFPMEMEEDPQPNQVTKNVRFNLNQTTKIIKPKLKVVKKATTTDGDQAPKQLSAYHAFISTFLTNNAHIGYKERMAAANGAWKEYKATL